MGEVIPFPYFRRADREKESRACDARDARWLPYRESPKGQLSLECASDGERACDVVTLRPLNAAREAYRLYCEGSLLDEDSATYGEAESKYRHAIRLDPKLAIAHTNLGNVVFRQGKWREARVLYEEAIAIDDRQPEAHYNLGYLTLEYGDPREAVTYFQGAIDREPRFADAHFNIAMSYEQIGNHAIACNHWHIYLDLEPTGTYASIARQYVMCAKPDLRIVKSAKPVKRRARRTRREGQL